MPGAATSRMPSPLLNVISSAKKIRERMTMKMGKVVDISERLIAVVV